MEFLTNGVIRVTPFSRISIPSQTDRSALQDLPMKGSTEGGWIRIRRVNVIRGRLVKMNLACFFPREITVK
jgi:hypothetical protein